MGVSSYSADVGLIGLAVMVRRFSSLCHRSHSGNYQQGMLLIMMPTFLYLVVISMPCRITRL